MPPTSTTANAPPVPSPAAATSGGEPDPTAPQTGRREWLGAIAAGLLALLVAAWVMRLWRADFSAPFHYTQLDDTKFYLALIRSVIRHGWYGAGTSLGAPFGQQLHDFPQGADNLNFLMIRVLALFSANPALIANVFLLLTFPLCAASAYAVMRRLGVAAGTATVTAVLFALLPYHFYRGESQLLLSAYYSVPLGAYLFLAPLLGEPLFASREPGGGCFAWISRRSVTTVLLCAVIASSGLYYAAFALVLLAAGALMALLARRGRRAVLTSLLCAGLIGLGLGANLAPDLLYRAEHGSNPALARTVTDTETLGLKPAQLLLPVQDHRLPPLHTLNRDYAQAIGAGYCEQCYETLGTAGDVGFLWLLGGALAAVLGAAGLMRRSRLYPPLALGVLLSLLIASVGGVSSLLAYFISPDVRGWNRMSLFIAFFSLIAVAMLVQAGLRALARRSPRRLWPAGVLSLLLVLGALDQTNSDFIPSYAASHAEYTSDTAFFGEVQATLGAGASVFELPYVPFPEGYGAATTGLNLASPNFGTTYEEARGYITSTSLRWSYGAMKGRPADWESELAAKPLGVAVAAAALSGFGGLVIEPGGYSVPPGALRSALTAQLAQAPLVSARSDIWFFDLRPYAAALRRRLGAQQVSAVRAATLTPLRVRCGPDAITLTGPGRASTIAATFTARLSGVLPTGALIVSYPDGAEQTFPARAEDLSIRRELRVGPAWSTIRLFTSTPTAPSYAVQVTRDTLTAPALASLAPSGQSSIAAGYPPPTCQLHPRLSLQSTTPAP